MVVILVLAIVSTIAIMNMGSSKIQLERQTVARELKVAFERARFDSVKRRAASAQQQMSSSREVHSH
jgi:Tfp pilus assembly protein FimT